MGHPSTSSPDARPGPAKSALVSRPARGALSYARSASTLNKSYGSRIPRSVTDTSNAGALLESIEAKISGLQLLGGERHEDPTAHGSGPWETAQSPSTGKTWLENAPVAREQEYGSAPAGQQVPAQALMSSYVPRTAGQLPSLPVEVTDLDVDDTSVVETPQPAEYWAGRFSTANDNMRNKAQTFASRVRWARDNTRHHDEVMRYLKGKCRTAAAAESLAAFVRKWEAVGAEWFGEE